MTDRPEDERVLRIGLNEAVFREVNERIDRIAETVKSAPEQLLFVCECGDIDCAERIAMTRVDYEAVRSEPTLFAVLPGHVHTSVEDVVETRADFEVLRKKPGVPAAVAEGTDPRPGTDGG